MSRDRRLCIVPSCHWAAFASPCERCGGPTIIAYRGREAAAWYRRRIEQRPRAQAFEILGWRLVPQSSIVATISAAAAAAGRAFYFFAKSPLDGAHARAHDGAHDDDAMDA